MGRFSWMNGQWFETGLPLLITTPATACRNWRMPPEGVVPKSRVATSQYRDSLLHHPGWPYLLLLYWFVCNFVPTPTSFLPYIIHFICSSVRAGVAHSVQCLTTDWTTGVRSPAEEMVLSSSLCVHTSSEAHPASYPMGTGGKARPGRDADHSLPSSAEVMNE
jgi:hypothetical protein